MKHSEIRSTVIATAYKGTINQAVKKYYEDGGLQVLAIMGLEVAKPVDQVKLPDYASYKVRESLIDAIRLLTVCSFKGVGAPSAISRSSKTTPKNR